MNGPLKAGSTTGLDTDPLVVFMLRQPGLLGRVLAQHVDDGRGRCRVCSSGGVQQMWPCNIRRYANVATTLMKERVQKPPPRVRT